MRTQQRSNSFNHRNRLANRRYVIINRTTNVEAPGVSGGILEIDGGESGIVAAFWLFDGGDSGPVSPYFSLDGGDA